MDGSNVEHSDSDSGESWTILESATYADDAPDFSENPANHDRNIEDDKDEDTDGISIISDSDPESATPCNINYDRCFPEETRPTELQNPQHVLAPTIQINNNESHHESIRSEDDFLGDNNGKMKTYVHRRNKRLSTVLNIIVLGSVITAAGVAIGHMWGARNDCSVHTTPSVNKILSNLYKLQEENANLRNRIKELTLMNNIQMQHRKLDTDKLPLKQNRCRKIFEATLNSRNGDKLTKCVDDENSLNSHLIVPAYEKEFLSDIDKLKNIYQQNKSWLDEEIAKRIKQEEYSVKKIKNNFKTKGPKLVQENKIVKVEIQKKIKSEKPRRVKQGLLNKVIEPVTENFNSNPEPDIKISYADSLKSGNKNKKVEKLDTNVTGDKYNDYINKKRIKKDVDAISVNSMSEDELQKDNRYVGQKYKPERKKHDRQKLHKKVKRRNKYEQWEMKGGYMKDFDDFSISSSQENEHALKNPDNNVLSREFEQNNYINQFSDTETDNISNKNANFHNANPEKYKGDNEKNTKISNWYDKRAALRTEARRKLERELFSETSPNTAGWYFRRMQKREQCRTKGDNSTYRKQSKRNMNFKMKC